VLHQSSGLFSRDRCVSGVCFGRLWKLAPLVERRKEFGRRPLPDSTKPVPGGWNRILLEVSDIQAEAARLRAAGVQFGVILAYVTKVLLWLFVINLGIAFGAGLYEDRIEFPQWLIHAVESGDRWNAQAARQANTGLRFWVYVTTVPLTLLALASLVMA